MKVFPSSKNYIMISISWIIVVFLLIIPFVPENEQDVDEGPIVIIAFVYLVAGMFVWILLDTKYKIKENKLFYCSGPIRGSMKIADIRKIELWNKWYVTSFIKPALDKDGMIIHYNKFDDIYISPKEKEKFIAALREINADIEVI